MMRRHSILLLCLLGLVGRGDTFKFMSKFKVPTLEESIRAEKVKKQFGDKKLVVITGTSSGLGRKAALALLRTGEYHVIGAVRDLDKMEAVAEVDNFPMDRFTPMHCELNSFESVRKFCADLKEYKDAKPIDRLICNAGVYQPSLSYAKWSMDGCEQTMQINFLSHFLMVSELIEDMAESPEARVTLVGSVTGNDNTVGGGGVYPIADLKNLEGFKAGFQNPIAMADGYGFIGAKAYKDSKLCLMMLSNMLHARYYKKTGIAFSSIYPGCIAESPLFREKRAWFRKYFPIFMKYITGGFVGEEEAGQRLFQVAHDPRCTKSGVYWSWNGGPREGRGAEALEKDGQISGGGGAGGGWNSIFENDQSDKVQDVDLSVDLFKCATAITGAKWPELKQVKSPCPTLKAIGAISTGMIAREEIKRMQERPGFNADGTPKRVSKVTKAKIVADKVVVRGILGNTIGRVARFASRRVLGRLPEEAIVGSYQDEKPKKDTTPVVTETDEEVVPDYNTVEIVSENFEFVADNKEGEVFDVSDHELIEQAMFRREESNGATKVEINQTKEPMDAVNQESIEEAISKGVFEADGAKTAQGGSTTSVM